MIKAKHSRVEEETINIEFTLFGMLMPSIGIGRTSDDKMRLMLQSQEMKMNDVRIQPSGWTVQQS